MRPRRSGPTQVIEGTLDRHPVPEIVSQLHREGATGILLLSRGKEEKKVCFREGQVVYASSTNKEEKLGYLLVEEGVIAKDGNASYVHSRSKKWLKFKCSHGQEFVIVGFTDPEGSRKGFGALLIGYHDDNGDLRYAGKVGTGYDDDFLESFGETLKSIERKTPPVAAEDDPPSSSSVHWVTPKYVGEVGFTEWTDDGKLRHPRFLGLRRDKDPEEIVREDKS